MPPSPKPATSNQQPATIKIRAHHLLCLQGFQGYGYNAEFIANMAQIVDQIKNDTGDLTGTLVVGQDDFCTACPHHGGTTCEKDVGADVRMKSMDVRTLQKLALTDRSTDKIQALIALSNKILKTQSDVTEICGQCPWTDKCLWYGRLL